MTSLSLVSDAEAAYASARALAESGLLDEARASIERARDLWSTAGHHLSALRTNLGLMQILDDLGRHLVIDHVLMHQMLQCALHDALAERMFGHCPVTAQEDQAEESGPTRVGPRRRLHQRIGQGGQQLKSRRPVVLLLH